VSIARWTDGPTFLLLEHSPHGRDDLVDSRRLKLQLLFGAFLVRLTPSRLYPDRSAVGEGRAG